MPSPETDRHPAAAASRFFSYEESEELRYGALIPDDTEIQAEAIADGDALVVTIIAIQDESQIQATIPVWTVQRQGSGPLRLREGSHVCVVGVP